MSLTSDGVRPMKAVRDVLGSAVRPAFRWFVVVAALVAFQSDNRLAIVSKASPSKQITWQPCVLRGPNINRKCGRYEVFEDREAHAGRIISLNVVVIPATSANPRPDPVFFFAGGPGDGAAAGANSVGRIGVDHDLVFVDQRGTGHSNPLNCRELDDAADLQAFFGDLYPPEKMRACREKLEQIADLRFYTTSIAVDDIDEVRAALGYDQVNLWGVSYGTEAALAYLRQHPQHVRAVLLAGVAPLNTRLPLPFARGAQVALDALFTDCAADRSCHDAFPNLRNEFSAVLKRFNQGKIEFEITNPVNETRQRVTMLRGNFVVRLLSLLYNVRSAARVPFLLHRAFEHDFEPFANAALRMNAGAGVARGVYFTVTCAESIPFITGTEVESETKNTFLGDYRTRAHMEACRQWSRANVPPGFIEPVNSDKPVLMISGMIDPATPFWLGAAAIKYLPNGRQLLVPNTGHSFNDPCVQNIAEQFLEHASVSGLVIDCLKTITRPPFDIESSDVNSGRRHY